MYYSKVNLFLAVLEIIPGVDDALFYLMVVGLAIFIVAGGIVIYRTRKPRRKEIKEEKTALSAVSTSDIVKALGGPDNILGHKSQGSRLTLSFKDKGKVDVKLLEEQGLSSYILYEDRIIIVAKEGAKELEKKLFPEDVAG